jgi:hypothetical protein
MGAATGLIGDQDPARVMEFPSEQEFWLAEEQ